MDNMRVCVLIINSGMDPTDEATHQTETYAASSNIWRLSTSKDADGNTTSYQYNGNYLSAIISASNDRIEFVYDGINLSSERVILADGTIANTTYYRYDSQNRLIQAKLDTDSGDNSLSDGKAYVTNYSYLSNTNLVTSVTQTDGSQLVLPMSICKGRIGSPRSLIASAIPRVFNMI